MWGVVQYISMHTARRSGEQCGKPVRDKRKTGRAIDGMVTQHELNAWLKDVGGDDAMLEELLSFESQFADGEEADGGLRGAT